MTVDGDVEGLGLAEAIGVLRDELLRARAAGAGSGIQLPVESMTVELTVLFGGPVDRDGRPVRIPQSGDELKG
ncbi:trypco2 family protein [Dactylosporangium cerinum]|uniref:Trypco2 family protein n=1 Tax=Dactylosporangium cerinum TaxID=1434730 RepID=A0ABV9VZX8_9ACTN